MPDSPRAPLAEPSAAPGDPRQRVRELEPIIQNLGEVVVVVDEHCRVVEVDGAVDRMWGIPREDLIGEIVPTASGRLALVTAGGEPVPPGDAPSARALVQRRTQIEPILGVRLPDGSLRWAHVVAALVPGDAGRGTRVSIVWIDLTPVIEHDPADDRVRARTAALELTVAELEAFSYTVSHDLRAPARTIATMVDALLEETAGTLAHDARSLLERIRDTATRMDALTSVLLQLGSVGRAEIHRTTLDLGALARDELERLRHLHPDRAVRTRVASGLVADGDEPLVRAVLQNLLTNAWKFTADTPDALIEVGMRAGHGERIFFVRDNGIGFDMEEGDRIFLPFERLRRDEFEGTGVGLATVRRVIGRHGGRVWAEGVPGRGATFFFTLTAAPACPLLADVSTRQ